MCSYEKYALHYIYSKKKISRTIFLAAETNYMTRSMAVFLFNIYIPDKKRK